MGFSPFVCLFIYSGGFLGLLRIRTLSFNLMLILLLRVFSELNNWVSLLPEKCWVG